MEVQDRRVKRTQRLLAQALIELTLEKGYEAVTIREITERADIGYATFFRHYNDKDALLQEVLEAVLDELLLLLQPRNGEEDPANVGTLLFDYVQHHNEVCRVLLSSRGAALLMQRMIETGTHNLLQQHTPAENSLVPIEIAAYHLVASSFALIQWWLEHDMAYPPERMGAIYRDLIVRPTHGVAFNN